MGAFAAPGDGSGGTPWQWSDGMFEIHGFAPAQVRPTLDLWLAHVHDDDRPVVRYALTTEGATGRLTYRLRDARRRDRSCILVLTDAPPRANGYLVDMTEEWRGAAAEVANAAIGEAAARTATLEQAVGIVVAAREVDPDEATGLLATCVDATGRDAVAVATAVVEAVAAGEPARSALARLGVPAPRRA
ncbi:hypothetical protein D1825_01240 [Cellulomonas rhizosphaerae]|uniref:PAS fold-3 domain-containing protein n=1 Tax=Cellulomonas rhizosphaerae TaxID=2293719 RepID=A0A413RRD5_9CELL|nr:hypothetical protein D1825_01240 [Cellulomonas rhizosphaerae]